MNVLPNLKYELSHGIEQLKYNCYLAMVILLNFKLRMRK